MRAGKVLLAAAACLIALLVACSWALPPLLDWSRFRGSAEMLASSRLGRPVTIAGPISLSLFPRPVLKAEQVSIADVAQGGGGSFAVQSLRIRVALLPLLSGRIDARDLVLRRPDVRLPWPVPPSLLAARPAQWADGLTARIEDGSVMIGDLSIDGIDATLGTDVEGTISVAGAMKVAQQPWQVAIRLGSEDRDGAASCSLALDGREALAGVGGRLSGRLAASGALDGRITMRGPDLSRLLPAPALPFEAEGHFQAAEGAATASDLLIDLGGSAAHGAVGLRIISGMRLDMRLEANRLDLDAWGPKLLQGRGAGMPIGLDLSAEAATLAGGLLRNVHAALDLNRQGAVVQAASAILPGDAALQLSGQLSATPSFDGRVSLDVPDVHATLLWLQAAVGGLPVEVPPSVVRSMALSGQVAAQPGQVAIAQLSGSLDGAPVRGSFAIQTGARPRVNADLGFDRLNADPVLPAHLPSIADLFGFLRTGDAAVTLHAAEMPIRGQVVRDLSLDAVLDGGRLDLRTLAATLEGIHARLSGGADGNARVVDLTFQAATDDARPAGSWIGQAGLELWRGPLTLRAAAKGPPEALGIQISAVLDDARAEAEPVVDLSTGRWHGAFTLRHPGAQRFVRALGLGQAQGTPSLGEWLGDGSLSLIAQLSGEPGRVSADTFDLTAGEFHTGGVLTLTTGGGEPRVLGKITAETFPLPDLDLRSDEPLPLGTLRGWQASVELSADTVLAGSAPVADHVKAEASLNGATLHVERLRAAVRGGEITGDAVLIAGAAPPSARLQARWNALTLTKADGLPLVTSGVMDGAADLTATGFSPSALLATASGTVRLHVSDGTLAGLDLPGLRAVLATPDEHTDLAQFEAQIRQSLEQGTTPFASLDATGRVRDRDMLIDDLRLVAASGRVSGSGDVSLSDAGVNLRLQMHPDVPGGPPIGLRVSGPVSAPSSYPELAGLASWLGERVPVPGLTAR